MNNTDLVCICTRNRLKDLTTAILSFREHHGEDAIILLVDSSDTPLTQLQLNDFGIAEKNIFILPSSPGLTIQRNVGLTWATRNGFEFIHFFDDDVTFRSNYTEQVNIFLTDNPDYVGAGGVVESSEMQPSRSKFDFNSWRGKQGSVNSAGLNLPVRAHSESMDVHWLPGCAMSFRVSAASKISFDETRPGYGLGEDVDFSLNVSKHGKLRHLADVGLVHHLSPANRLKEKQIAFDSVKHRFRLSLDFPNKVSALLVLVDLLGEALASLVLGLLDRNKILLTRAKGIFSGILNAAKEYISVPKAHVFVLNGGLGNQLFILAAAVRQSMDGQSVYLDTSAYKRSGLRSVEISALRLPSNIKFIRRKLLVGGYYVSRLQRYIASLKTFSRWTGLAVHVGYFQESQLVDEVRSEMLKILASIPVDSRFGRDASSHLSAICHIRAGDYLLSKNRSFHGLLGASYFNEAIASLLGRGVQEESPLTVGVICDTDSYVKALALDFDYVNLEAAESLTTFEILAIMSQSKKLVLSNSSLSWWGAFLSEQGDPESLIIAPNRWYASSQECFLYRSHWKVVEADFDSMV